jgi:predicted ATP-grasp superfamily ATP-dependent carboligase
MIKPFYKTPALICDAEKLAQVATIQELGKHGIPIIALSSEPDAIGFHSKYVSKCIHIKFRSYTPQYIEYLVNHLPTGVIFYSNDANAECISKYKNYLSSAGFKFIINDYDTISKLLDKYELYLLTKHYPFSCPKSILIQNSNQLSELSNNMRFPVIVKPTNLAGGVYSFATRQADLPRLYHEMKALINSTKFSYRKPRLMLQEWVDQRNSSLWNFNACAINGNIISYSMGRRLRTDVKPDGSFGSMLLFGESEFNEAIYIANKIFLKSIYFSGIVETEWSMNQSNNAVYLYDFNPRPAGNIRWVYKTGVSLALHYYCASLQLPITPNRTMNEGIKYYKILCHNNDFCRAVDNPYLSLKNKFQIFCGNLQALLNFRDCAIDIFDPQDIRPTIVAVQELPLLFGKATIKFLRQLCLAY